MASPRNILAPFSVAFSGVLYTFRTQRHMRIHLYVTAFIIIGALILNLRTREILVLLFMINFVLVAEMFNSAIEATVDLVSPNYHPLAKFAKDISAGAVLVTTIMAVTVGALIAVGDDAWDRIRLALTAETPATPVAWRIIISCLLLFFIVVIGKGLGKRGTVLKGGFVSGHAAYGFFLAGTIMFISDSPLVTALAIVLAMIVAQSRWEAKIHSISELVLGATVGLVLSLLAFGLMPK